MSKKVIFKFEGKEGTQEFPISVQNWEEFLRVIFENNISKVASETLTNILETCNDQTFIGYVLAYYSGLLTEQHVTKIMNRFPRSKVIQSGLIAYAADHKRLDIAERVAANAVNASIKKEATDILEYED